MITETPLDREPSRLQSFQLADSKDYFEQEPDRLSKHGYCCHNLLAPAYWHLFVIFGIHTALQFGVTYSLLNRLPQETLSEMQFPTSLEATQTLSETLKLVMDTNMWDIYGLLLSLFFYCQLWHIPLTWVFALLCGACMPNLLQSGLSTHMLNVVGVACNFYLSRIFLAQAIQQS